jgi:hypothetical protein
MHDGASWRARSPSRQTSSGSELAFRFLAVRARTLALAAPLSAEDCQVQSMPDASPVKWHLAHVTWFWETFLLERFEDGFQPFDPAFRVLFNSYYDGIGERAPRPMRGLVSRPSLRPCCAFARASMPAWRPCCTPAATSPRSRRWRPSASSTSSSTRS